MTTATATGAAAGVRRQGYRRLLGFGLVLFGAAWGLPAPGAVRPALAQPAATAAAATTAEAAAATPSAGAGPEEAGQPPAVPAPRRFKLGVELDANFRHSDDTRVASRYS